MRLQLVRRDGSYGYYLLPFKPDNPARPARVYVLKDGKLYAGKAWVDYDDGRWLLELPYMGEDVELIYLE